MATLQPICQSLYHRHLEILSKIIVLFECSDQNQGVAPTTNFNQNLWQSARGLLSPIEEDEEGTVKFASLSCTHTNQVLRLFHYGMEHSDEKYTSHGKLSKEKLRMLDSEYHDAVEHGLWWDVISADLAEVLDKFPSLPTMLQACYNTGAPLQRRETELQMARRNLALRQWVELQEGQTIQADFSQPHERCWWDTQGLHANGSVRGRIIRRSRSTLGADKTCGCMMLSMISEYIFPFTGFRMIESDELQIICLKNYRGKKARAWKT